MKKVIITILTMSIAILVNAQCSDLFFSEYIEGSSSNKAIEVYNPTSTSVDLADYVIYRANNGSITPTDSLFPQGTLAPQEVFVIANPSAIASILAEADTTHTLTFYNGDDALWIQNRVSGDTLDIIGEIGVDPGSGWVVGTGATSNFTLIRDAAIQDGNTVWSSAVLEWVVYPIDMVDSLGMHTGTLCGTTSGPCYTDMFFSEYIEGSSSNKALELYNPTPNTIDLTDYVVYRNNNGSMVPTDSLFPQGTLGANTVFVIANPSANAGILAQGDTTHTITFYNGDDALWIKKISTGDTLDIIGEIGVDPGASWVVGTGATGNFTLIRNIDVHEGNTIWTIAATEWDVYTIDMIDSLGFHSMSPCPSCNTTYATIADTACDIYNSPSGFYNWTSSGTYNDTILNSALCDSIIQIDLVIYNSSTDTIYTTACDFYVSPSGNYTWYSDGVYSDTIPTIHGCDSVFLIVLDVISIDTTVISMPPTLYAADTSAGNTYQWLDCNMAYAEVSGATSYDFTPFVSGSFAVEITNGSCVDTSSCYQIIVGQIDSGLLNEIEVYPNPSKGDFNINFGEISNPAVRIIGTDGKVLFEQKSITKQVLNIHTELEPGIYFLEIKDQNRFAVIKLLFE